MNLMDQLTLLHVKASVSSQMLATPDVSAVATQQLPMQYDYPVKCDLFNIANPIFGFFVGQAKGVVGIAGYSLLFFLFLVLLFAGRRASGVVTWIAYIFAALIAIPLLGALVSAAYTGGSC